MYLGRMSGETVYPVGQTGGLAWEVLLTADPASFRITGRAEPKLPKEGSWTHGRKGRIEIGHTQPAPAGAGGG